jgi:hypothetical protein
MEICHNERHLRTNGNGPPFVKVVVLVASTLIIHTEHADASANHFHRLGILGGRHDEINHTLGKMTLSAESLGENIEFRLVWELSTMKKIHNFLEAAVINEVIDVVA